MDAEISSILGLEVYTDRGVFVGKVEDAVLDADSGTLSGIAVGSLNKELFDLKGRGIDSAVQMDHCSWRYNHNEAHKEGCCEERCPSQRVA
jgi:Uncharacterized conserved protein